MEMEVSYQQLKQQIEELRKQAEELRKKEKGEAIARIKDIMLEYGITVNDLMGRRGNGAHVRKGSPVAPKYRHPATGETWTGRGKMPRWLQAEVNKGRAKEDFAIHA